MNGISNAVIAALSATLLHALWQGTLAALLLSAGHALLRPDARARHASACLALASLPLMALVTFVRVYRPPTTPMMFAGNLADPNAPRWLEAAPAQANASAVTETAVAAVWPAWGERAIVLCWAAGAALLFLRELGAHVWLRRTVRAHAALLPEAWQQKSAHLASRLGLRSVRFVTLASADVPFTFGWLRAVVVVPTALLTAIPAEQLELLVMHELVHIRRGDYAVNVLQTLAECLFFFHPAAWWLSRVVRREREMACDEEVLAGVSDPVAYARALTELEALRAPEAALAASGGELATRVKAILGRPSAPARRPAIVASLALAASLAVIVAACSGEPLDEGGENAVETSTETETPTSTVGAIRWLPASVAAHRAVIANAAAEQSVDPELVALMVLVESGGDATVVSPMGARGLMQLMPSTAAVVARAAGVTLRESDLDDPRVNLRLGTRLLFDLLAEHEAEPDPLRRIELALAGYNAGRAAVRAHLDTGAALPDETQRYTRLLLDLYRERHAASSPAYEAWRARAHARWRNEAADPVPGAHLTSSFGHRKHPVEGRDDFHRGVDLALPVGRPVLAPLDGVVEEVGQDASRGVFVVLRHKSSLSTRYHHLARAGVAEGDTVSRGEAIGTVGSTGVSTGSHLHLEVLDHGEPIDPARLFDTSE